MLAGKTKVEAVRAVAAKLAYTAKKRLFVSKVYIFCAVKTSMNTELPFISEGLLMELSSLITTWEAIRKAKGIGSITGDCDELHQEVMALLTAFDQHHVGSR